MVDVDVGSNTCGFGLDRHMRPPATVRALVCTGRAFALQGLIRQGCRTALAAVFALLVLASTAHAQAWRPHDPESARASAAPALLCSSIAGRQRDVAGGHGPQAARQVYAVGLHRQRARDLRSRPEHGRAHAARRRWLLQRKRLSGCASGPRASSTPIAVVVSPDGLQVYVATQTPGAVAIFNRDPATGDLSAEPGTPTAASVGTGPTRRAARRACARSAAAWPASTALVDEPGRPAALRSADGRSRCSSAIRPPGS